MHKARAAMLARWYAMILFLRRMINQSVVMATDVASAENGSLDVGDPCKMTIKKGSKTVTYNTKLLGIGASVYSCSVYCKLFHIALCTICRHQKGNRVFAK